jgi:hypothetical protein
VNLRFGTKPEGGNIPTAGHLWPEKTKFLFFYKPFWLKTGPWGTQKGAIWAVVAHPYTRQRLLKLWLQSNPFWVQFPYINPSLSTFSSSSLSCSYSVNVISVLVSLSYFEQDRKSEGERFVWYGENKRVCECVCERER